MAAAVVEACAAAMAAGSAQSMADLRRPALRRLVLPPPATSHGGGISPPPSLAMALRAQVAAGSGRALVLRALAAAGSGRSELRAGGSEEQGSRRRGRFDVGLPLRHRTVGRWLQRAPQARDCPFFSHIHFFVPPLVMLQNIFDLTNTATME